MNKSNERRLITEQGARPGPRAGASRRKPEIICLEKLRKERELLRFSFVCGSAVRVGGKVTTGLVGILFKRL